MQETQRRDRAAGTTSDPRPGAAAPSAAARRAIDCGGPTGDERTATPQRTERGHARHAWVTSAGRYADQVQSI